MSHIKGYSEVLNVKFCVKALFISILQYFSQAYTKKHKRHKIFKKCHVS